MASNWLYIESERAGPDSNGLWTTGFYDPAGKWVPETDHATREEAARRCAYLNGGAEVGQATMRCHRGHTTLAGLWNCPQCTDRVLEEGRKLAAEVEAHLALAAPGLERALSRWKATQPDAERCRYSYSIHGVDRWCRLLQGHLGAHEVAGGAGVLLVPRGDA